MNTIEISKDSNLLNGVAEQVGEDRAWIFVDGTIKTFGELDAQETASLIVKFNTQKQDGINTGVHLVQSNNIPIDFAEPQDLLEEPDRTEYLQASNMATEAHENLVKLQAIWAQKYSLDYTVVGY